MKFIIDKYGRKREDGLTYLALDIKANCSRKRKSNDDHLEDGKRQKLYSTALEDDE